MPLYQPCRLAGLPGPDPGNFLYAQKVTKKAPGAPRPPLFSQSVSIKFAAAQPLKQQILRASDLRRVSRPASAVALLTG